MEKFIVAAIQMNSQDDKEENLKNMVSLIQEGANRGAKLIALPENANYLGPDIQANAEEVPNGPTFKTLAQQAIKHGVWIHCGSIPEKNTGDPRPYNTTMVINPKGELAARYRKIHTFDVDIKDGPKVRESDRICPGDRIVTLDTQEVGHLGLSICYDIRFGEMFRWMALRGANIFSPCQLYPKYRKGPLGTTASDAVHREWLLYHRPCPMGHQVPVSCLRKVHDHRPLGQCHRKGTG